MIPCADVTSAVLVEAISGSPVILEGTSATADYGRMTGHTAAVSLFLRLSAYWRATYGGRAACLV